MEKKRIKQGCKLLCHLFTLGIGITLVVLGVLAFSPYRQPLLDNVYQFYLEQRFSITRGSNALNEWTQLFENGLRHKYYFYNVTNVDKVIEDDALPDLKLVGPYTYGVERTLASYGFYGDDGYLRYTFQDRFYRVDESKADDNWEAFKDELMYLGESEQEWRGKSESDVIYTVNLPLLTVEKELEKIPRVVDTRNGMRKNMYLESSRWETINRSELAAEYIYRYEHLNPSMIKELQRILKKNPMPTTTTTAQPDSHETTSIPLELFKYFDKENIITNVTVGDLLWGWKSDALESANNFIKDKFNQAIVDDSTYGISYQKNKGDYGRKWRHYYGSILDGLSNTFYIGQMDKYNRYYRFAWRNPIVRDGTVFPPIGLLGEPWLVFNLFLPEACKYNTKNYVQLELEEDQSEYSSPLAYDFLNRYILDDDAFQMNVDKCHDNRPISVVLPSTRSARPLYKVENERNWKDEAMKGDVWLVKDMYSGKLHSYRRRLAYNALIDHSFRFPQHIVDGKPVTTFPIAIKEESFELDSKAVEKMKKDSHEVKIVRFLMRTGIPVGFIVVGSSIIFIYAILILVNVVKCLKRRHKESKTEKQGNICTLTEVFKAGYGWLKHIRGRFINKIDRPSEEDKSGLVDDSVVHPNKSEDPKMSEAQLLSVA